MAGNHSAAVNFNKNILIQELGLKQISNTTAYYKDEYFILSPSIQNSYNWFDLREVNLNRYKSQKAKGYLLIRFFDKFLIADLDEFIERMVSDDNYVETKVSGVHWKFIIHERGQEFMIINQTDKSRFFIEIIEIDSLKRKFNVSSTEMEKVPDTIGAESREKSLLNFFSKIFNKK